MPFIDNTNMRILIGIDPDIDKSGVCEYYSSELFELSNLRFFELFDKLASLKSIDDLDIEVVIEAGWLNKSNWHKVVRGSSALNANIGARTGANHEVGKKIVEMCEYLKLKHRIVKPIKSKIDAKAFEQITKYKKRTNQEQRDSAMLVFGY